MPDADKPKRKRGRPRKIKNTVAYKRQKERVAKRGREASLEGRDIAPIPKVKDRKRRNKALKSLRTFCETYFPLSFPFPWSDDHLDVIAKLERAIMEGGQYAISLARGFGKSTLCEKAVLWALFTGEHKFVPLIGSDNGHAKNMLDAIKVELESNELLLEDFPEIVYPIHKLERIYQRSKGQLYKGKPTFIDCTSNEIVLPTIAGSRASGGVIRTAGLEGRIRGMKFMRPDGQPVRPSLVIIDDPQTDESARSPQQVQKRLEILSGAILNLAGPGKQISAAMPLTVVQQDDLADKILNPQLYPTWQGDRKKFVLAWPERMDLWEKYTELRKDSILSGGRGEPANEFYKNNREEMDRGSKVSWEYYYVPAAGEISAIQRAMNLRYKDVGAERAFMAEFQNEPLPPMDLMGLGAEWDVKMGDHLSGLARGIVPHGHNTLSAFIDVQGSMLFWMVVAWDSQFTGHIVDYGAFPEQGVNYFTLVTAKQTLAMKYPNTGLEGLLFSGMKELTKQLLSREWHGEGGAACRIQRCFIDANWGDSTEVVYKFCRVSEHAALLMPCHGRYVGASSVPFGDYSRKRNDRVGLNWRIPGDTKGRGIHRLLFDANFWKTFITRRMAVVQGDPGALTVFGRDGTEHAMLRDHFLAEFPVETEGRGRKVQEWKPRANRDNHWWDCLVGCAVGASLAGITLAEHIDRKRPERRKVSISEKLNKRRGQNGPLLR